jgi:hypothetical protein
MFFEAYNFCLWRPLLLLTLGAKNVATPLHMQRFYNASVSYSGLEASLEALWASPLLVIILNTTKCSQ